VTGEAVAVEGNLQRNTTASEEALSISVGGKLFGSLIRTESGALVRHAHSGVTRPIRFGPLDPELAVPSFFSHMLPDVQRRRSLSEGLGCAVNDGFELLRGVGGDLVGDVTLSSLGQHSGVGEGSLSFESLDHLTEGISELRGRSDSTVVRAFGCLPGGSEKVSVRIRSEALPWNQAERDQSSRSRALVRGDTDSSRDSSGGRFTKSWTDCLVKFEDPRFPGLLANEALTRRAASAARVRVPLGQLLSSLEGVPLLLVERFDREGDATRTAAGTRLAVEDGCQVLGVPATKRYEISTEELGVALSNRCQAPLPLRLEFFRLVVFSSLAGHGDLHGSNIALRRDRGGEWRLAPAFDLACTAIYGDDSMALTVGGQRVRCVNEAECLDLGAELGLPRALVLSVCADLKARLTRFIATIVQTKKLTAVEHKVVAEILSRLELFRLA
jgi:serine/threonine-protein kinase HipA